MRPPPYYHVFLLLFAPTIPTLAQNPNITVGYNVMINDMSRHFGEGIRRENAQVLDCFDTLGNEVGTADMMGGDFSNYRFKAAHNTWWQAFYQYSLQNDPNNNRRKIAVPLVYFGQGDRKYPIVQPCNYTSNQVYYRSAQRVCDYPDYTATLSQDYQATMVQSFAQLAVTSMWFHGASSFVGAIFDNLFIATTIMTNWQVVVSQLTNPPRILQTLHEEAEFISVVDLVPNISSYPLRATNASYEAWVADTDSIIFQRDYEFMSIAYIALACAAFSPDFGICRTLVGLTGDRYTFNPMGPEEPELIDVVDKAAEGLFEDVLDAIEAQREVEQWPVDIFTAIPLFYKGATVFASFGWALQFQGRFELIAGIEFPSELGAAWTPVLEGVLSYISGYDVTDNALENDRSQYPGANKCNDEENHALWHQTSADALFEMFVYSDELAEAIREHAVELKEPKQPNKVPVPLRRNGGRAEESRVPMGGWGR